MDDENKTGTEKKPAKPGKKSPEPKGSENLTGTGRGKVAYDAYGAARNWTAFNGDAMPKFEEQSPELQAAWNSAAQAVANAESADNLRSQARIGGRAIVVANGKRLVIEHVQSYGPSASGRPDDVGISFYGHTGQPHNHEIGQWIPPVKKGDKALALEARQKSRDEMLEALDELFGALDPNE